MTRSIVQFGVCLTATLIVVAGSSVAMAQGREVVVNSRVVSDVVTSSTGDNYVGDMSMSASGCNGGNCSGGNCSGGNCGSGNCSGGNCGNGSCGGGAFGSCGDGARGSCGDGACGCGKGLFGSCKMCGKDSGGGGCYPRQYGRPDLFYNFYTQGNCNRANAQMYMSPLPTPPNVGHTFFTYQPFYPHEMLYHHKDRFHNYYDNGRGMNRTKAVYSSPPLRQAMSNIYWNILRLPR